MAQPLVSVIMIFLDARPYIAEAIASVETQTLTSWELVLVDDGSTDGTRDVAALFAARDPDRIRLVEHAGRQNHGTGPSRNLGMAVARGRYITFLDADDVYEPRRLERTVALLESDPALGVVISRELYWRSWAQDGSARPGLARRPDEVVGPASEHGQVVPPPVLIVSTLATRGAAMPGICSITFRRQSIEELGGIPEQFRTQYEDQALIVKLLMNRSSVAIPDCLAKYRQHAASLTHRAEQSGDYLPGRPHPQRQQFVEWVADYAASVGIHEPVLTAALQREAHASERRVALAVDGVRRRLRRTALLAANALLPQRAVDSIVRWYVDRQTAAAERAVARNAEAIQRGEPPAAAP